MKSNIIDILDFKVINNLLQGLNKTTEHLISLLDLKGDIIYQSVPEQKRSNFRRVNFELSKKCNVHEIGLVEELPQSEKYEIYKGLNGLIEVAVPIKISGEHVATLFSGQFFFEKPEVIFYKKQAVKYGFNEDKYLKELKLTPVISKEKVKINMMFLLNLAQIINELGDYKLEQIELNEELKDAEEINLKRKKRLDYALESIDTGVWELDLVNNSSWRSFKHDKIFGYSKPIENWTYEMFLEHVYSKDKKLVNEKFQNAISTKSDWNFECRIVRKDNAIRWIQGKGNHFLNEKNEATLMYGVVQDITDRKLAEIKIKESEEKFRLLYNNSPDMFVSVSPVNGTILICNETLQRKTGYTEKELIGASIFKLYHNDCMEDAKDVFQQFVKTGEIINKELILKKKDGSKIEVSLNVYGVRDENGKIIHSMSSWRDITVRKKAEKELKESEEKFRTFSNISPVGIFVTDENGKATYYNYKTSEIIGMPIEEGKGTGWAESVHPNDREKVFSEWNKCRELKSKFELTYRFKNKQGKITWVIGQAVPMLNTNGELLGFVGSLFDITSQKQTEIELSNSYNREKNLGDIVRNAPIAIAYGFPDGRLDNCNNAFIELVGYTKEELKNINWSKQLTPLHWNAIELEALQKLTSKNDSVQYEKEYIHKNGTVIPVELFVIGNFNKKNELINFVGFVIDITERKQYLKNLKDRYKFIESIMEKAPIGFAVTTIDNGEVKFMNSLFENIYGWPKKILTNNNLFFEKLFPDSEFRDKFKAQAIAGMQSGDPSKMIWNNLKIVTSSGEVRYVDASNIFIADENIMISTVQDATQFKLAEDALRESEIKYRSFFENSMDSIMLTSPDGKIISANPAACEMLGYTENEIIQLGRKGLIDPTDSRISDIIARREKDGKVTGELTMLRKGNVPIQVELSSAIFVNSENQLFTSMIIRDVTERKRAEVAFKETAANLKSMIDNREDAIWSIDRNYNYIIFNSTYEKILNKQHNIKLKKGMNSAKLLTEEQAKFWIPKFESVFEGENVTFEFSHVLNGELRHFLTSLNPIIEDQLITGASGLSTDITERKQIEETLKISEEKFEKSFRLSPYMVSLSTMDGLVVEVNEKVFETLGYTRDEFIGKNTTVLPLWVNLEERVNFVNLLKEDKTLHLIDVEFRKKTGEIGVYLLSASIIEVNEKKLLLSIIHDITEQKKVQEELISAKFKAEESDRLKSAFLANMSHEIRTPMNGILGFSELLKTPDLSNENQQKYIGVIERSGARMLNIIQEIIDISKIESGAMEVILKDVNVNTEVENVYNLLKLDAEQKGIHLSFKNVLAETEAKINTDANKLEGILINLVKNAIKYTDVGSIEFGYKLKGNYLEFYVKDTGIGIPKNRQDVIFERFIQADITDVEARQGAGLGLSISKALVNMLGGEIWVESIESKGSIFYFTIEYNPVNKPTNIAKNEFSLINEDKLNRSLKILIVEDDEPSQYLISLVVDEFAKEILVVDSGLEAIETCKKHHDIDIIFMDIQMPEMNGYEATKQIRKFNKNVIIIAQTAFALSGDKEKAIEIGCNDYISKPIGKSDLIEMIRRYSQRI